MLPYVHSVESETPLTLWLPCRSPRAGGIADETRSQLQKLQQESPSLQGQGFPLGLHIIWGWWSGSTPRFPKNHWEIVEIHDFSSNLIDFYEKLMAKTEPTRGGCSGHGGQTEGPARARYAFQRHGLGGKQGSATGELVAVDRFSIRT